MQEARLYQKREQSRVDCLLCSHFCAIPNHRRGLCGVRENRDGRLYSLVYGKIVAEQADPVEKKTPLSPPACKQVLLYCHSRL